MLIEKLQKINIPITQFEAEIAAEYPYMVLSYDGEGNSLKADNTKDEMLLDTYLDLYTRSEADFYTVQRFLNEQKISNKLSSIQLEPEKQILHYEWELTEWLNLY